MVSRAVQALQLARGVMTGDRARTGPLFVTLDVTQRCNLRCIGCRFHPPTPAAAARPGAAPAAAEEAPPDMPLEVARRTCAELRLLGTRRLLLIGEGEPLLHPGLVEMVRAGKAAGLEVFLTTNGLLLDTAVARELVEAGLDRLQVSLVDSSSDGTTEAAQRFPFVRIHQFAERRHPGDARNAGVSRARAEIIAFLDADCFVEPDWIEQLLRAHRSSHLAVGSVIENGSPHSPCAWAYYFLEFNLWLPRPRRCEIAEMAGCGLSIKRAAFDRYGPFLEGTYCSDSAFQWRMARDGERVLLVPEIRVFHTTRLGLTQLLRHVAEHRRSFAVVAARERRLARWQCLAAALAVTGLPPALLAVVAWRVLRSQASLRSFVRCAPIVLLGTVARAWGEMRGFARLGLGPEPSAHEPSSSS